MTVVTQMPRPGGRSTQGSIGVRECNERVAQATCTGLGTGLFLLNFELNFRPRFYKVFP